MNFSYSNQSLVYVFDLLYAHNDVRKASEDGDVDNNKILETHQKKKSYYVLYYHRLSEDACQFKIGFFFSSYFIRQEFVSKSATFLIV